MVRALPPDRQGWLAAIGGCGLIAAAALYAPYVNDGPILCLSHGLLGLPCPSCGLTRAFCHITRGEWLAAARQNLLAFPLFAACLASLPLMLWSRIAGPVPGRRLLYSAKLGWWVGGAVGFYHCARLVWWAADGALWTGYVQTSWSWRLLQRLLHG